MNVSKTLASAVAAMAVVGSIGIAYAQTTSDASTSAPTTQTMDPNNATSSTMPNPSSTPSATDNSTLSTDLTPQADRG